MRHWTCVAVVCIVFSLSTEGLSQLLDQPSGSASLQAVGNVSAVVPNSPSVLQSHSALMDITVHSSSLELSYRQPFGLDALQHYHAAGRRRVGSFTFGAAVFRLGQSELYQEYGLTVAVSRRLHGRFSSGLALEYITTEYGDNQARYSGAYASLSTAFRFAPSVVASIAANGLTLDPIYKGDERSPQFELTGAWSSIPDVTLGAAWTHTPGGDNRFGIGQSLHVTHGLDFLAGIRFGPVRYSVGGCARYQGMGLVYSYQGHTELGGTHTFGLTWNSTPVP